MGTRRHLFRFSYTDPQDLGWGHHGSQDYLQSCPIRKTARKGACRTSRRKLNFVYFIFPQTTLHPFFWMMLLALNVLAVILRAGTIALRD